MEWGLYQWVLMLQDSECGEEPAFHVTCIIVVVYKTLSDPLEVEFLGSRRPSGGGAKQANAEPGPLLNDSIPSSSATPCNPQLPQLLVDILVLRNRSCSDRIQHRVELLSPLGNDGRRLRSHPGGGPFS